MQQQPVAIFDERFFTEIAGPEVFGAAQRVWMPGGLWEIRTAMKVTSEIGVTCAFDPLVREPGQPLESYYDLEAPALYFRIAGARAGMLRDDRLADVAELIEHYGSNNPSIDLTIAFATVERWQDARSLKKLVATEA